MPSRRCFAMQAKNEKQDNTFERVIAAIRARLDEKDDGRLWGIALNTILSDAQNVLTRCPDRQRIILQVGSCSHWLAPNKLRWMTKNGQFAGPAGYGSRGGFFGGIPEFDWSMSFATTPDVANWNSIEERGNWRSPLIRVAIPARTASRIRASAHVLWERGPRPDFTLARLYYGFRRSASDWRCRAYCGPRLGAFTDQTATPEPSLVPAIEN